MWEQLGAARISQCKPVPLTPLGNLWDPRLLCPRCPRSKQREQKSVLSQCQLMLFPQPSGVCPQLSPQPQVMCWTPGRAPQCSPCPGCPRRCRFLLPIPSRPRALLCFPCQQSLPPPLCHQSWCPLRASNPPPGCMAPLKGHNLHLGLLSCQQRDPVGPQSLGAAHPWAQCPPRPPARALCPPAPCPGHPPAPNPCSPPLPGSQAQSCCHLQVFPAPPWCFQLGMSTEIPSWAAQPSPEIGRAHV